MDALQLQSFVMVLELGSLSEAGKKLGVTPAAVAARVRSLEEEVGVPLVKRSGRFVKPTQAGINILERTRYLLREMRDLRVAANSGDSPGELRLGVFPSALTSLLPRILKKLYNTDPALNILVASGTSLDLCRDVDNGSIDAAIVVEPQYVIPKSCEWRELVAEPLVLVAPAALAGREAHELLRSLPFIRYDRTLLAGQLAERYLREHEIQPRERLELDALMAIAAMVDQGLGVSLLPDWQPMWHSGLDIVRIQLPARAPVRKVGLIWAAHGARVELAEKFYIAAKAGIR